MQQRTTQKIQAMPAIVWFGCAETEESKVKVEEEVFPSSQNSWNSQRLSAHLDQQSERSFLHSWWGEPPFFE